MDYKRNEQGLNHWDDRRGAWLSLTWPWVCLAQLNFISKGVFLENSFMSNLLGEAELFWKKYLVKQLHQQLHTWMGERNEGES